MTSTLIGRLSRNDGLFRLLGQSWAMRLRTPPETVGNLYHEEQKDQLHRDDSSQSNKIQVERCRSNSLYKH